MASAWSATHTSVGVDLNSLPTAAIERIEVLADGASAIYGTDAIAGVINFITKREFKGFTVAGDASVPTGRRRRKHLLRSATAGFGSLADEGSTFSVVCLLKAECTRSP